MPVHKDKLIYEAFIIIFKNYINLHRNGNNPSTLTVFASRPSVGLLQMMQTENLDCGLFWRVTDDVYHMFAFKLVAFSDVYVAGFHTVFQCHFLQFSLDFVAACRQQYSFRQRITRHIQVISH